MNESLDLLSIGSLISLSHDRYGVLSKIGAGGYGSVWKVERLRDGAIFALKTINPLQSQHQHASWRSLGEIQHLMEYAQKEMAFLNKLGSQAAEYFIIPIIDQGEWQHPELNQQALPILIMPFYGGGDLSRYCKAYPRAKPYTTAQVLQWAEEIATALAYLHQQQFDDQPAVHRDIKPANILLNQDLQIGLTDFGIARLSSGTGTTTSAYSRHFCAPEQVLAIYKTTQGHNRYLITPAVDVYSLGILLHELLTGSTQAQEALATTTLIDEHNQQLPLTDQGQFSPVGLLGQIGGLNSAEQRHLLMTLERLFAPPEQGTLVVGSMSQRTLPYEKHLITRLADLLQTMLAPWPEDRPTAAQLVSDFQQLRQALNPNITHFQLGIKETQLAFDQPIIVQLYLKGRGLTRPAEWLSIEVNHRLQAFEVMDDQEGWLYPEEGIQLKISLPAPTQLGEYRIDAFALTREQTHKSSAILHLATPPQNKDATPTSVTNTDNIAEKEASIMNDIMNTNAPEPSLVAQRNYPLDQDHHATSEVIIPQNNRNTSPFQEHQTPATSGIPWSAWLILILSTLVTFSALYYWFAPLLLVN